MSMQNENEKKNNVTVSIFIHFKSSCDIVSLTIFFFNFQKEKKIQIVRLFFVHFSWRLWHHCHVMALSLSLSLFIRVVCATALWSVVLRCCLISALYQMKARYSPLVNVFDLCKLLSLFSSFFYHIIWRKKTDLLETRTATIHSFNHFLSIHFLLLLLL